MRTVIVSDGQVLAYWLRRGFFAQRAALHGFAIVVAVELLAQSVPSLTNNQGRQTEPGSAHHIGGPHPNGFPLKAELWSIEKQSLFHPSLH